MKKNIVKISKRLMTVSNFVKDNSFILDIGCDHALLDIYLYQIKKDIQIVVSDIHELPLNNAKNNLIKYDLNNIIETRLGNGLEVLDNRINTIIITGMGGKTITEILNNKDKLININNIVLSPNSDYYEVRKSITNLGYAIDNEEIIKDKGIYYLIISFTRGYRKYSYKELYIGPLLIINKSHIRDEYFKMLINKKTNNYKSIPKKYFIQRLKLKYIIYLIKSNIFK